jgi:hypothetical protein
VGKKLEKERTGSSRMRRCFGRRSRCPRPGGFLGYAGGVLGASMKLQSTARGVSHGLRFPSLTTVILELVVGLLRWVAPNQPLRRVAP